MAKIRLATTIITIDIDISLAIPQYPSHAIIDARLVSTGVKHTRPHAIVLLNAQRLDGPLIYREKAAEVGPRDTLTHATISPAHRSHTLLVSRNDIFLHHCFRAGLIFIHIISSLPPCIFIDTMNNMTRQGRLPRYYRCATDAYRS